MLVAVLVTSSLAVGLAACGGDDDSSSSVAVSAQGQQGERGAASEDGGEQHEDSGGGAERVHVKGGDNSVQEFGEEASASQLEAAATTLHNYLDARAQGSWDAACEYMAKTTLASFETLASQGGSVGDSCGDILEKLTNPAASREIARYDTTAELPSLRREGTRAFVIYTGVEGAILAMPMADEGGVWKVAGLVGTPLN
jgi:hypothetical protein